MTNELHKLSELSTARLRAMLKLITEEPNGDIDIVRLAVRIRAELATRENMTNQLKPSDYKPCIIPNNSGEE
jgi:hypothetical protein